MNGDFEKWRDRIASVIALTLLFYAAWKDLADGVLQPTTQVLLAGVGAGILGYVVKRLLGGDGGGS